MELFKAGEAENQKHRAKNAIEKTEGLRTRSPDNLGDITKMKNALAVNFQTLTQDALKQWYKAVFGKTTNIKKSELAVLIAGFFTFTTAEEFETWFFSLPQQAQRMLYAAAFSDNVCLPLLQKENEPSFEIDTKRNYWERKTNLRPEFKLDFLTLDIFYGCPTLELPPFFSALVRTWLEPPALSQLSACQFDGLSGVKKPWDNSLMIADTFPLLCDALRTVLYGLDSEEISKVARNGFSKKDIKELYGSTGFLPFDKMEDGHAPDSVDLAARFILCMSNYKPTRPNDGQDGVRSIVQAFFSRQSHFKKRYAPFPDRAYLEYSLCIDHLTRSSGAFSVMDENALPASRKVFSDILTHIANSAGTDSAGIDNAVAINTGTWFDVDKLLKHIRINGEDKALAFCDTYMESSLKFKTQNVIIEGIEGRLQVSSQYGEFRPEKFMRYYLLARPLFKAYCYIFAALGILEIIQETPPLVRTHKNKPHPISPYDSVKAIRITALGRWCLGLTETRPPKPSHEYQAIADTELLLVTIQGSSLERQVYLDKVGKRLGEDRWRISPASFIEGCANKHQITERVERFKALIDPSPAPHWEALFKKVVGRSGLFDNPRADVLVYDLPESADLQNELLGDPELKKIIRRAEGRMLVIAAKDKKKFFALLQEHGIAHF